MKTKIFLIILAAIITGTLLGFYFIPISFSGQTNNITADTILSDSSNAMIYTCPMHPEITSDKTGTCPKCGMNLELKKKDDNEVGNIYTCPMHPDVTSDKPGTCPKCGMDLIKKEEKNKDEGMMNKQNMKGCNHGGCGMDNCTGNSGSSMMDCAHKHNRKQ